MDPRILENLKARFGQIIQGIGQPNRAPGVGSRVQTLPQQITQARQFTEQQVAPRIQSYGQNIVNRIPAMSFQQVAPVVPPSFSRSVLSQGVQGLSDYPTSWLRGAELYTQPQLREQAFSGDVNSKLRAAGDMANFIPFGSVAKVAGKGSQAVDIAQAGLGQTGKIKLGPILKGVQTVGKLKGKGRQLVSGAVDEAGNALRVGQSSTKQALSGKLKVKPVEAQGGMQGGEDILSSGYQEIGSFTPPKKSLTQKFDEFYTNWVDKYNPIVKAATKAEKSLEGKAQIRPEFNPKYTLKRFLGMGGIAEHRYNTELKPILNKLDEFKIPEKDIDLYLKSRRDINLGQRGIKGSDADIGIQRAGILESKYGTNIKQIADQLYDYQKKGFEELSQAGFLEPQTARAIQTANADYVPFQRVMDKLDDYLGIPSRTAQQSVNPVTKIKGSEKQIYSPIESIIANTYKQRAAIEKNNVARSIVNLNKIYPELGFYPTSKSGTDTISVWENGQKVHYRIGEDMAEAVKGLNEENINSFLKVLTVPAQILRQGATGRNPEFMIPNLIRDQFDAALNSKYGYVPFIDWAKGLAHIWKKDDVYQAWMNSGAAQNLGSMSGRQGIHEMLISKTAKKKIIRRMFDWLGQTLDWMGKYSEQPTRVGLFERAYKTTGNPLIGAMESREGTLDFARMGAKMKVANSIIPFLNVGIQGFDKAVRSAKDNPFKFAAKMTLYGILPAATTTLYNTQYYPEEYSEIPQFVKDDNFIIVTGRNDKGNVSYISIPKGNVIRYITNPTENFISHLAGTSSQSLEEAALLFLSSGLPVLGEGQSLKEIGIKTIGSNLPQAIKPLTENLINRSFYKYDTKDEEAKDIVPYYLNKKPAGERSYEFTPQVYQVIGKVLNVSPLQVQNLMEGYLAGYVKIPVNIIENLNNINEGKPVNQNQIPILRRFMQETYPSSSKVKDSEIDFSGGTKIAKNNERADIISSASAAESNTGKLTPDQLISQVLSDNEVTALEKKQISNAISQINEEIDKVYESKMPDNEKEREITRLDELKTKLQESDNKKKEKLSYLNVALTGDNDLDKRIIARQQSELSDAINETIDSFVRGEITQDQANKTIAGFKALQDALKKKSSAGKGGGRKPKKLKITRMKAPAFRAAKPKRIKTKKVRLPKIKLSKPKVKKEKQEILEPYIPTI